MPGPQKVITLESLSRNMAFRQTHSAAGSAAPRESNGADGGGGQAGQGREDGETMTVGEGTEAEEGVPGARPPAESRAVSLADEQAYVTMLYGLLDAARARSEGA